MGSKNLGSEKPMVIPVNILGQSVLGQNPVKGSAMIDCSASTQFIDRDFTQNLNLTLDLKPKPETLIVVDEQESENRLTHTCTIDLMTDQHLETVTFQVTKLAGWQMILGKTWLK